LAGFEELSVKEIDTFKGLFSRFTDEEKSIKSAIYSFSPELASDLDVIG
jgi:hypothetical protein